MLGARQHNLSSSRSALISVDATESVVPRDTLSDSIDDDHDDLNIGPPRSYFSLLRERVYRRKRLFAIIISGVILILAAICIAVVPLTNSAAVIPTPTPTPLPVSTTSTTASPTPTTSTTPTTTSTSTTIPTTSSTTSSTTTTTKMTTTTTKPTTSKTTPPPAPRPPVPTKHPLPPEYDIQKLPAKSLLIQVGLILNWTKISCGQEYPPAFRYVLRIDGVPNKNYTGESDKITHAEEAASTKAVKDLFGIVYHNRTEPPPPPRPCIVNATILPGISGGITEDSVETTHIPLSLTIPDEEQK